MRLRHIRQYYSWRWLLVGMLILSLVAFSEAYSSWSRISEIRRESLSFGYYLFAILINFNLWVLIAVVINWLRQLKPITPKPSFKHWLFHGVISLSVGVIHLVINSILLWLVFSGSFSLLTAVYEKLARWLPYEILAYWACLGMMTVYGLRYQFQQLNHLKENSASIAVKDQGDVFLLKQEEIDWVEAMDNYVVLWSGKHRYIHKSSLKQLLQKLDQKQFAQVHRSTIVNLKKVSRLVNNDGQFSIELFNGKQVAISRRRKAQIKALISSV